MNCNQRTMRPMLNSLVVAAVAALGLVMAGTTAATPNDDATSTQATQDTSSALVQLNGDPLSTYIRTKPPQGKKIDFYSNTTKSYRAQLSALRNDYKQWLKANVPQAKVTGEFDISLNAVAVQLNGATLAQVAAGPQVKHAEYEGLYHPSAVDIDSALISAPQAWAAGGSKGDGIKIAIVDTGIDQTHPCFSDAGYTPQTQLGDKSFTNNKVIVAKVFNNKTPSRKYTPEALQLHGTHVAGTAACNENTPAPVDGVTTYDMSGVAPRALLGNYNVFPGDDTTGVTNARSEDILNALEAAYADGFDVANMSLGGSHGKSDKIGGQDLLAMAVDNLDQANMVVAVAAGNSGPGFMTIESPGSAARALTAGAATVGHFIGAPITPQGGPTFAGAIGDFATVETDLTAPLHVILGPSTNPNGLNDACAAFPAGSLSGEIALVTRGTCTFSTKIRNAQNAGAVAVLVGNNVFGDPVAMGQDGTANQPTIPAYMVSRVNAGSPGLKDFNGVQTTIGATLTYLQTGNNDFMAGFSSQGPTDVDFRVKPDVVAPGVNVLSSIPHQFCDAPPCFTFLQGTSMATPHLAGGAAVVIGAHPNWSAWQVRSAVVNNADVGVLRSATTTGSLVTNVNIIGSGRENLLSAVNAGAGLSPVSVSFGAVPSGSGQTLTFDVTVTNLGSGDATFPVSVGAGGGGVAFSVSPSSVSLASGAWTVVTVTMTAAKGAAAGDHQATLTVGGSHGAVYTFIK